MKRNARPVKKLRRHSEITYYKTKSMNGAKKSDSTLSDKQSLINSKIYQILSQKERTVSTLIELNKTLESEANLTCLNINDPRLDGSFLHYLTQTAQAGEE